MSEIENQFKKLSRSALIVHDVQDKLETLAEAFSLTGNKHVSDNLDQLRYELAQAVELLDSGKVRLYAAWYAGDQPA